MINIIKQEDRKMKAQTIFTDIETSIKSLLSKLNKATTIEQILTIEEKIEYLYDVQTIQIQKGIIK